MSDFNKGRAAVDEEVTKGDFDITRAMDGFLGDPPDSEFTWGYFARLAEITRLCEKVKAEKGLVK